MHRAHLHEGFMAAAPQLLLAAVAGAAVAWLVMRRRTSPRALAAAARACMPRRVVLIRHGESEGNADQTLYRNKADNLIELTAQGVEQAEAVGHRLKKLLGDEKALLVVSPFERTLQTARKLREAIEDNVVHTHIEPRVREQEFGNLQGVEFKSFREEQQRVGRFFYRFPTGESGADVHNRVCSWWEGWVKNLNQRPGYEPVDTLIVVTHGLTMRLVLMQLFGWSPNTFSTVWNAGNCSMYVLKRSDEKRGDSPYELCPEEGDELKSSIDLLVSFTDDSKQPQMMKLHDYLALPPPRTCRAHEAAHMLAEQHNLDPATIKGVDFFSGRAGYDRSAVPPPQGDRRMSTMSRLGSATVPRERLGSLEEAST